MPSITPLVLIVTGSGSGFGLMIAQTLARAGHIVYGGFRAPDDGVYANYQKFITFSRDEQCHLKGIHLDVTKDDIIQKAVGKILQEQGRIDGVIHNAGHMCVGPAEAFTEAQFFSMYDTNCVGSHRLNRAVLPVMRNQRSGLLVWVGSNSTSGPSSPYLSAYFAAKAAQDSYAQTLSIEVSHWGIESSIVVPGIFTEGTNHFGSAMSAEDKEIQQEYETGPLKGRVDIWSDGCANMTQVDIKPQRVADAVLEIVNTKHGKRPWRIHIEPEGNMAEKVDAVRDQVREEYLMRMKCADLLKVSVKP